MLFSFGRRAGRPIARRRNVDCDRPSSGYPAKSLPARWIR
jgi:hypothetical protein